MAVPVDLDCAGTEFSPDITVFLWSTHSSLPPFTCLVHICQSHTYCVPGPELCVGNLSVKKADKGKDPYPCGRGHGKKKKY